jgi:hypothetical protein
MTAAVRVPRQAEFLVESSDSAGQQLSGDLTELSNARFEDAAPVRSFPSFKKQRNFPGWWWSATVDRLVGFESWLERDQLMQVDFEADVVGMASQPMLVAVAAEQPVAATCPGLLRPAVRRWWRRDRRPRR